MRLRKKNGDFCKRKSYFRVSSKGDIKKIQTHNKKELKRLLAESEFNIAANLMDLHIHTCLLKQKDNNSINENFNLIIEKNVGDFQIMPESQTPKIILANTLHGKDFSNISDRNYSYLRKSITQKWPESMKKKYFPSLRKLRNERVSQNNIFNNIFQLKDSKYGVYCNVEMKIKYVLENLFKDHINNENLLGAFRVKFCLDGTNLCKKNIHQLNVTFTIIDDFIRAKTVIGNYLIGKKNFFYF